MTVTALECTGMEYDLEPVNVFKNEQNSPDYLAINPNGEIPCFDYQGRILTQNAAIIYFLSTLYSDSDILPPVDTIGINQGLEDLTYCSNTLHILRRQMLNPARSSIGDPEPVRACGAKAWARALLKIQRQLEGKKYWYGDRWSIIDVYVTWSYPHLDNEPLEALGDLRGVTIPPMLIDHAARVWEHPNSVRGREREMAGLKGQPFGL